MAASRLALLCGLGGIALAVGCAGPAAPPPRPPAPVRVARIERDELAEQVELPGTVVPLTTSAVAAGSAGKVIEYPVREGDHVRKDDVLARLRSVNVSITLEGARATLRERQARYDELRSGYRDEEKRQAEAVMRAARADLTYSRAKLERTTALQARKAVSADEFERAVAAEAAATQSVAEAEAMFELKSTGYRAEEIAQARAAFEAQKQRVLELEDILDKRTIRAPFDGYVVRKQSDVGQWIEQGGPVATLVDLGEVDVVVQVEESLLHLVRIGQQVELQFDALRGESLEGVVREIVPRSDWQGGSRSFPVKVRVTNVIAEDGLPRLKEGMLSRVLLRGAPRTVLLVHKDAVVRSSGRPVVYRVDGENRVQHVAIEEGASQGEQIEIRGQLSPGDVVVVEGNERLRPAQLVKVLEARAPPTAVPPAKGAVPNPPTAARGGTGDRSS